MKKHPIATIVNFSKDNPYIGAVLSQAEIFSRQVIVPVLGNTSELLYAAFPGCLFVEYPPLTQVGDGFSRLVGHSLLHDDIEAVLFLDADEVPDGARFNAWLDSDDYMNHMALKFDEKIVMARKEALNFDILLDPKGRDAIYDLLPHPKRQRVTDAEGKSMFYRDVKPVFEMVARGAPQLKKMGRREVLKLAKIERFWNFLDFKRLFRR